MLVDLPTTVDPDLLAIMDILLAMLPPGATYANKRLHDLSSSAWRTSTWSMF
jgi:hypothetical protein